MPEEQSKPQSSQKTEEMLFSWTAPSRPFKKRSREFYVTVISIAALFGIILFLVEGILPVILIVSLLFLFYVMSNVEPEQVNYQITTRGIRVANKLTEWINMSNFWYINRLGSELLVIGILYFPGRLEFVIKEEDKSKITSILKNYIEQEESPQTTVDKVTNWASKKLPQN